MNKLTNAQIAVMKTPAAMEIIANEAYASLAVKLNTTSDLVKQAVESGNENALKMFAQLVTVGINQAASLVE
ncbi:hypothetical protein NVP1038O_68 [Vibrio phage 1.038.O._10N.286.51.C2]|nr:hypothetical protein NVP1038O_68 [Vibrio phage 1.038.O._10N.286.51.C2]